MTSCLALSNIRCVSWVNWSNPGKRVAPSPTPWCSSYRKGNLRVTLDYVANFTLLYIYLTKNYYYYYILHTSSSHYRQLVVFHWIDSKSPQVSRTRLSILTDYNNAIVWIVSTHPPKSNSSSSLTKSLGIVPSAQFTTSITVTFMFHSFFSSLARSNDLSLFLLSLIFTESSTVTAKSTIRQFLFFY